MFHYLEGMDTFRPKRERLSQQLAESRARIDEWIDQHEAEPPSLSDLCLLEGLLSARRSLLAEVADLDDAFMNQLLHQREME